MNSCPLVMILFFRKQSQVLDIIREATTLYQTLFPDNHSSLMTLYDDIRWIILCVSSHSQCTSTSHKKSKGILICSVKERLNFSRERLNCIFFYSLARKEGSNQKRLLQSMNGRTGTKTLERERWWLYSIHEDELITRRLEESHLQNIQDLMRKEKGIESLPVHLNSLRLF